MELILLPIDKVEGIYETNKNILPARMRFLHPYAAVSFDTDLVDRVVVSDMFRSAKESLAAMRRKKGVQPPGWSPHNYGLAVDLAVTATLRKGGFGSKRKLDDWMESVGWFCHRRDHVRDSEEWHYNYLGEGAIVTGNYSCDEVEARIQELYGDAFAMDQDQVKKHIAARGYLPPITKISIKDFQTEWGLAADGIAGPKTKRVLGYLSLEKST